jgi:hypothetical protein
MSPIIFYCIYLFIFDLFKKMVRHYIVLFISLLIMNSLGMHLHLLDNTQAQIDALKAQQDKFVLNVNKLITNIS